jgi:glycosyltransferase involved in cell wall biosynthesis
VTGDAIRNGLQKWQVGHLNIQYHHAFFPREVLVEILEMVRALQIDSSVTIHNTKQMIDDWFLPLIELDQVLFVHEKPEVVRLQELGLNRVEYIPQGVLDVNDEDPDLVRRQEGLGPGPVIGCFGFLRPHKGLLELIRALPMVLEAFPRARLLALNARYPSPDSAAYEAECRREIMSLDLDERVRFTTEYLAIDSVIHQLHAADINVLPYHESDESASAAANVCLASRRPLLVSASGIFSDVAEYCGRLPSSRPEDIAATLISTVESPEKFEVLRKKAVRAVNDRSWSAVGQRFIEIVEWSEPASRITNKRR